jgi:hypothetical protein
MVGAWRATRSAALADAVRCRLAHWTDQPGEVTWLFPGVIEDRVEDPDDISPSF